MRFLQWLKSHFLLASSLFLVVFIPLWPKIPLWQPIPGYIVRVRLEDIFVGLAGVMWLVQLLRRKVSLATPLKRLILLYLGVGAVSLLSAFFVIRTIPLLPAHIEKALLHLLRYAEYFSLFFLVFTSIKKPAHIKFFLSAFAVAVVGATLYGIGQKYLQWPVYSTMSWEFSAGVPLELVSSAARVQSTFAGHYDFAIFMDLLLPFIMAFGLTARRWRMRLGLGSLFALALWSLLVSGLRTAFASFGCEVLVVVGALALLRSENWRARVQWGVTRAGGIFLITGVFFLLFGSNLASLLGEAATGILGTPAGGNGQAHQQLALTQYEQPVPRDQILAYQQTLATQPLDLSGCAQQRELSLCIRLESLWPQAMKGFWRNPLLGSGYSTLNKRDFYHLAEADGVDNNYLRILGETGLLGFIAFGAILVQAGKMGVEASRQSARMAQLLAVGLLGALLGILGNAVFIDVFAASKVAFTFWAIVGVCLAAFAL